jgi:hypothetical protein
LIYFSKAARGIYENGGLTLVCACTPWGRPPRDCSPE